MAPKRHVGSSADDPTPPNQPQAKKTRLVDPSEDPARFEEDVESALENPSAKRKGRVKEEGYESDSTDDGEGVVFSRRKRVEDEDDDMFANNMGKEEDGKSDKDGKKKVKFLELGDIEFQEFGQSGSEESAEDDEPEDEDDAERRKKAGMGFELSSFNMREEMEEGKFTEDGTYVRSFDPHGVHDRWMEGLGDNDIKLAKRRKRQRDREQREKMKAEERELEAAGGKERLQKELLSLLKKGETVLEALQRLGAKSRTAKTR
jgi:CD2 antigen cytoplasmic tail-binding protein 2